MQNNQLVSIRKNSIYLLALFIFTFSLTSLFIFLSINSQLFDVEMLILSSFFFFILTYIIVNEKEKFTPLVFFSLLFYGYIFSGLYFSYYENISTAKFFNFSGDFTTYDMKVSLFQVIIGYVFFVIGYKFSSGLKTKRLNFEIKGINYNSKLLKFFLISLFFISFFYWIFVSYKLSGGPIELLNNIGIYRLLLSENPVSTAPYILGYASISLLFLIYLKKNENIPIYLIIMIILIFMMKVSTGRLSGSVFLLISFPLMYIIYYQYKINLKVLVYICISAFLLGALYFFRFYSNLSYLGIEIESDLFTIIGKHFFGMTNFGDLQSVTFASQYTQDVGYLYGRSFIDFIIGWISKLTAIEIEMNSIGLRLREYYFSHVSTGAPAPGIISEMIMNFGFVGITFIMFLFGILTSIIANSINYKNNIFNLYIYVNFLLFIMLLSKVDSSHINSFIWSVIPVLLLSFIVSTLSRINLRKLNEN